MNRFAAAPWCGLALLAVQAGAQTASGANQAAPSAAPAACAGPEHRQFDFWVGYWELYGPGGNPVGHNLIEKLHNGCVIREQWMPLQGGGGTSLNYYDRAQARWHQTWIDGSNTRVIFEGGQVGDKMVLTGFWPGVNGPGKDGLIRMTYIKQGPDSIHQTGEISTDHGITWGPSFDFTYERSAKTPPPR